MVTEATTKLEEMQRELRGAEKELYIRTLQDALRLGTRAQLGVDSMVDRVIGLLDLYMQEQSGNLFSPLTVSVQDSGFPSYVSLLKLLSMKTESVIEMRRHNSSLISELPSQSVDLGSYLKELPEGSLAERVSAERTTALDITARSIREAIEGANQPGEKKAREQLEAYAEGVRLARFYLTVAETDMLIDKDAEAVMDASLAGKLAPLSLYEAKGAFKEGTKRRTVAEATVGGYVNSPGLFVQATLLGSFNPKKLRSFFSDERCTSLAQRFKAELERGIAAVTPKGVFDLIDKSDDVVMHSLREISIGPFYTPYSIYSDTLPEGARVLLQKQTEDPLAYILRIGESFVTRPMADFDADEMFPPGFWDITKRIMSFPHKQEKAVIPAAEESTRYYYVVSPGIHDDFLALVRAVHQKALKQHEVNPAIPIYDTYVCNARGGRFELCS